MNEHEPGSRLDTAIDRAVRQIMSTEPPPGLRRRVLRRLGTPAAEVAWWPRLGFAAATVAAIVLAAVYLMPPAPERPATPPEQVLAHAPVPVMPPPDAGNLEVSAPGPEPPPAPIVTPAADAARTARVERLPDPPRVNDVFGPRPDGRIAAATVDAPGRAEPEPLPDIEPLQVPPLAGTVAMDAQDAPAQARPPAPAPVNIRVDLTLTEDGEGAAAPKTVSMLVANQELGRVRSGVSGSALNVDARPSILQDGRVRVALTVEYSPGGLSPMTQSLTTVLVSGKPLVVSQAADPKSTRRVQAELTATIVK